MKRFGYLVFDIQHWFLVEATQSSNTFDSIDWNNNMSVLSTSELNENNMNNYHSIIRGSNAS